MISSPSSTIHLDVLAVLVPRARADREHAPALRLLLRGVGQHDAAGGQLLFLEHLDDQTVIKRLQIHEPPSLTLNVRPCAVR